MNDSRSTLFFSVSGRYASALLEQEKSSFSNQFKKTIDALMHDPYTQTLLTSEYIDKKHLVSFMDDLAKILELSKTFTNFLKVLVIGNRFTLLPQIYQYYEKLWNQKNNTLHATIYSATKLEKFIKEKIEQKLSDTTNKKIYFNYKIKSDLLGGFLVDLDNIQIDATILNQINILEKKLRAA